MADYNDLFNQYGQQYNLPNDALRVIAMLESNMNPEARNPVSSAGGLFQFVDGTAPAYGLTGNKRYDPQEATRAAAQLARDNASYLKNRLGREPTVGELYLAHQQGMGGAAALLGNPGETAVGALTRVYGGDAQKARRAVVQNGGNVNMTAGDFAGLWTNKAAKVQNAPIPPRDVAGQNAVATQLDVRRPSPSMPTPMPTNIAQARTINSAMSNGMSAPNPDFYRGIFAPQQPAPRNINTEVNSANSGQDRNLANALENYISRPPPYSAGQTVASIPTTPRVAPASDGRRLQAQEQAQNRQPRITTVATVPTTTPYSAGQTISTVPTLPRLPPIQPASNGVSARVSPAAARLDNGQSRPVSTAQVAATPARSLAPIGPAAPTPLQQAREEQNVLRRMGAAAPRPVVSPNARQLEANTGFRVPNMATQPSTVAKDQARLSPQGALPMVAAAPAVVAPRLGVTAPVGMPTPSSMRPRGITGYPTAVSQRPMMSAQMGRPAMSLGARPPLNVVVQGARTMLPPQQAVQQQYINPSNHNPAQLAAIANGQSTFVSSPGSVSEPVRAMNGKIRNTY